MSISLTTILVSFFSALTVSYLSVQSFNYRYEFSDTITKSFYVARAFVGTVSFLGIFVLMTFIFKLVF
jgi:hypothetical protein